MWFVSEFCYDNEDGYRETSNGKDPINCCMEPITDEETGLELNEENIEKVLEEIRPYLVGAAGGSLELVSIEEPIVKVRITVLQRQGVMTVRVAVYTNFERKF